jgi:hypothetical protein
MTDALFFFRKDVLFCMTDALFFFQKGCAFLYDGCAFSQNRTRFFSKKNMHLFTKKDAFFSRKGCASVKNCQSGATESKHQNAVHDTSRMYALEKAFGFAL